MEIDLLKLLEYGISVTLCIILIWRVNPAINGLKGVVNTLVIAVNKQTEVVDEDSTNTRELRQEISNLRVEISKINGKK